MKQMSMEVFLTVVVICALPVLFGGAIRSFVLSYSEKNFAIAGLSHCPEVKLLLGDRITEVRTFWTNIGDSTHFPVGPTRYSIQIQGEKGRGTFDFVWAKRGHPRLITSALLTVGDKKIDLMASCASKNWMVSSEWKYGSD